VPRQVFHYDPAAVIRDEVGLALPKVPASGRFVYSDSPEVQRAVAEFERSGKAPIIKKPGFEQHPYGENQPIIYCQPLRACDIELEAGEEILGIALGDTVRWDVMTIFSGDKQNLVPHLITKPKDYDISTNLVVSTTRRTYHIGLIAKDSEYVRQFKFYYPHELIQFAASKEKLEKEKEEKDRKNTLAQLPAVTASQLSFDYKIENESGVSWCPVRAFDDGKHVYIQMPRIMRSGEAPVLMVRRTGTNIVNLVNYRVKNNYYVVDRLFDEAVLLLGVGDRQEKVVITKNG